MSEWGAERKVEVEGGYAAPCFSRPFVSTTASRLSGHRAPPPDGLLSLFFFSPLLKGKKKSPIFLSSQSGSAAGRHGIRSLFKVTLLFLFDFSLFIFLFSPKGL